MTREYNNKGNWKCDLCNNILKYRASYKTHIKNCTGVDPFPCSQCDRRFKHKSLLERHLECHEFKETGVSPHVCSTCNKCFRDKHTLKRHELIHTGDKPLGCTLCEKSFLLKQELVLHYKSHSDERPYSCLVCKATFKQKSGLYTHEKIHKGERNYLCGTCGKSFGGKGTLRRHEKLHTGVKPFSCKMCSKSFLLKFQLKDHEKVHTDIKPYLCKFCGKSFKSADGQRYHEKVHTGEKPFKCHVCQKQFRIKHQLKEHERRHTTGEKPYACATCDKRFTCSSSLRKHKKQCELKKEPPTSDDDDPYMACFSKKVRLEQPESSQSIPLLKDDCETRKVEEGSSQLDETKHNDVAKIKVKRPFACATCDMRFACSSSLRKHKKKCKLKKEPPSSDDDDPYMACSSKKARLEQPESSPNIPLLQDDSETRKVEEGSSRLDETEHSAAAKKNVKSPPSTDQPNDDDGDPYMACFRRKSLFKLVCQVCSLSFYDLQSLKDHAEVQHGGSVVPTSKDAGQVGEGSRPPGETRHPACPKCGKKCRSVRELRRHERTHHSAPLIRTGLRSRSQTKGSDETIRTAAVSADHGEVPPTDQAGSGAANPGPEGNDGHSGAVGKFQAVDFNENVTSDATGKDRLPPTGESRSRRKNSPKLLLRFDDDKCVDRIVDKLPKQSTFLDNRLPIGI